VKAKTAFTKCILGKHKQKIKQRKLNIYLAHAQKIYEHHSVSEPIGFYQYVKPPLTGAGFLSSTNSRQDSNPTTPTC
jgi:hypothetical protein